jgi:methylglutaconyl-CoA hydratase
LAVVTRDFSGGVARLTLDSPHNRNALSTPLLTELNAGLDAAQGDDAIRVIVLSGAGPVFCSGADLKEQRQYKERGEPSPVADLLGLVPAVIAVTCVPRMTERAALELFLTGETFDATRAAEVGLINRAVDDLDAEVERYLEMLRLGGPNALAAIKPMLATVREQAPAFDAMAELSTRTFASEEGQEGLRSFAEKRKPNWA